MSSIEWLQPDEEGNFPVDRVSSEVFTLKQRFPLFDPKRTTRGFHEKSGLPNYLSRVMLETPEMPLLPMGIDARPVWVRDFSGREEVLTRRQVITPFHPEMGYPVTEEDMDPETRREKVGRLRLESRVRNQQGDYDYQQTDPLMILVDANEGELKNTGWVDLDEQTGYTYHFRDEALRNLIPLRLLLHFPESLYVGKTMDMGLGTGNVYFHEYVPVDIPHLTEVSSSIREGFCLFIPTDPTSVQQIEGEFIKLG